MQVTMLVFAKRGRTGVASLRRQIGADLERGRHAVLYVESHKTVDRSPGWMKVKAIGHHGVLNVEWDADCRMLIVRAVSKGREPHGLLGVFLEYLLKRHGRRVRNIAIQMD